MADPLVFLGAGEVAVPLLDALAAAGERIGLVVTQPPRPKGRGRGVAPTPVAVEATRLGLPVETPANVNDHAFVQRLKALRPEFLVVADYGQFLKAPLLSVARAINLHPSLLPRWRGPAPVAYTILSGDALAGVSVMFMDEGMDSGPLLAQESFPLELGTTTGELTGRLAREGAALFVRTLAALRAGEVTPRAQDPEAATFSRFFGPDLWVMDWTLSPAEAARRINALSPRPGMRARLGGKLVKLLRAEPAEGVGKPGEIVTRGDRGLLVGCGGGILRLLEVHPEGRRAVSAAEFANSSEVSKAGKFELEEIPAARAGGGST